MQQEDIMQVLWCIYTAQRCSDNDDKLWVNVFHSENYSILRQISGNILIQLYKDFPKQAVNKTWKSELHQFNFDANLEAIRVQLLNIIARN